MEGEMRVTLAMARQRRDQLNEKYKALRSLLPNHTKGLHRRHAIEHLRELRRTVTELKILVEEKKHGRNTRKTPEVKARANMSRSLESVVSATALMETKKVTISIERKERISCLVSLISMLDDLSMEILNFTQKKFGDCYVYIIETKARHQNLLISPSLISKRVLEAVDMKCNWTYEQRATEYISRLHIEEK